MGAAPKYIFLRQSQFWAALKKLCWPFYQRFGTMDDRDRYDEFRGE